MLEELLAYLETTEGPVAYLVLGVSATLEYVFPPFPGDTITLFGTFLAATAGYSVALVYGAITGGSVAGGMLAWGFGRFLGRRRERWPALLRRPGFERAVDRVQARFERHGAVYLALNRFVPALRAFFFVAAGISGMRAGPVALYGALSAAAWNALLLTVGWSVGANWERVTQISERYASAMIAILAVAFVGWLVRRRLEKRQSVTPR